MRGKTLKYVAIMTDATGQLMVDAIVEAGPFWYGENTLHIELTGWSPKQLDSLAAQFDEMPYDEWQCAYTLAEEGWDGTPEDLIIVAKELTQ